MTASELGGLPVDSSIAIVGMACYFPDATSPEAFWRNLAEGRESVRSYDDASLRTAGVSEVDLADPAYVRAGVPLDGHDLFDAAFFGLSPKEAKVMDPQHRKFLECAWSALEDAGHTSESVGGNIGVFAGSGMHWYLIRNVMGNPALVREMGEFLVRHTANDKDFLATRVSYHLDLRGPSMNVQTACSTSLAAVHLACQSLLNGESDLALAGGSTIDVPHNVGYVYREEEIRSRDGHCRALDADATGTVFGSGCGVVVLRRLRDAINDGDTIHAVIRGSAINNDGARKANYLAPSVDGQALAIAEAIAVSGVEPESIGYVETPGTGTKIGDPIEVAALTQGFGPTARRQYCALGSVKSNIGHLDTAAGVAGLIKVVLAMRHRKLPPSLHFRRPNPEIDLANSPFYVNAKLDDWPQLGAPLRAGVSSFGVGGTNVHVVLEEAPDGNLAPRAPTLSDPIYILPLSAKTPSALAEAAKNLRMHLESHPDLRLQDVAWTLRQGRVSFEHRMAVTGRSIDEIIAKLRAADLQVTGAQARPDAGPASRDDLNVEAAGLRWAQGVDIDWEALGQPMVGRRIPLPTYPFQRQRHWLDVESPAATPLRNETASVAEASVGAGDGSTNHSRPNIANAYVAPESELQKALVAMWEAMLGIRGLGIEDNFFELGGHSLLLTRLTSRLSRERGIALPLEQAFEVPTIAHWSELASAATSKSATAQVRSIPKVDRAKYKVALVSETT